MKALRFAIAIAMAAGVSVATIAPAWAEGEGNNLAGRAWSYSTGGNGQQASQYTATSQ